MAHETQDPGGFRAADQGLATAPVRRISAGHQWAASLAPTLGAARTMEGPAAAAPIKSGGSARAMVQSILSDYSFTGWALAG